MARKRKKKKGLAKTAAAMTATARLEQAIQKASKNPRVRRKAKAIGQALKKRAKAAYKKIAKAVKKRAKAVRKRATKITRRRATPRRRARRGG
jgi:hypothetical protein